MNEIKKIEELITELSRDLPAPSRIESKVNLEMEKVRQLELENDNLANANKHRKGLVIWMTIVVSLWLLFSATMVVLQFTFDGLTPTEMCALLTTTTANVLGLAVIVLKGLFRKS